MRGERGAPGAGAEDRDRGHAPRRRERRQSPNTCAHADEARLAVAVAHLDPAGRGRGRRATSRARPGRAARSARRGRRAARRRRDWRERRRAARAPRSMRLSASALVRDPADRAADVADLGPALDGDDHLERHVAAVDEKRLRLGRRRVVEERRARRPSTGNPRRARGLAATASASASDDAPAANRRGTRARGSAAHARRRGVSW